MSSFTKYILYDPVVKAMVRAGRLDEIFRFDEPVDEVVIVWNYGAPCTIITDIDVRAKCAFYDRLMTLVARYRDGDDEFTDAMNKWFFWRLLLSPDNTMGLSPSTVRGLIDNVTRHYCRLP